MIMQQEFIMDYKDGTSHLILAIIDSANYKDKADPMEYFQLTEYDRKNLKDGELQRHLPNLMSTLALSERIFNHKGVEIDLNAGTPILFESKKTTTKKASPKNSATQARASTKRNTKKKVGKRK